MFKVRTQRGKLDGLKKKDKFLSQWMFKDSFEFTTYLKVESSLKEIESEWKKHGTEIQSAVDRLQKLISGINKQHEIQQEMQLSQ